MAPISEDMKFPSSFEGNLYGYCEIKEDAKLYTDFVGIETRLKEVLPVVKNTISEVPDDILLVVAGTGHPAFSRESQDFRESTGFPEPDSYAMEFYIGGVDTFKLTDEVIRRKMQRAIRDTLKSDKIKCKVVSRSPDGENWKEIPHFLKTTPGEKIKIICDGSFKLFNADHDWGVFSGVSNQNFRSLFHPNRSIVAQFGRQWIRGEDFKTGVGYLHRRAVKYCK